ncbi:MAG: hypothetical protein LBN41_04230 [Enterobacteriaceae bacterium]|jgi:hypothetical protein|nr:hypothetical protein [Enterobacteriaceae bacterium]
MITDVKIFDLDSFNTLFSSASPIKVNVRDEHKATKFQVESGETRSDHVVVEAIEIDMELILSGEDMKNTYESIRQAFDKHQLLGIQTKVRTYSPMLMINFPHDELPEMLDAIKLSLHFTEWRTIEPEYGELPPQKVEKKQQSGTVNRGKVQTQEADEKTKKKGSVLTDIFG